MDIYPPRPVIGQKTEIFCLVGYFEVTQVMFSSSSTAEPSLYHARAAPGLMTAALSMQAQRVCTGGVGFHVGDT